MVGDYRERRAVISTVTEICCGDGPTKSAAVEVAPTGPGYCLSLAELIRHLPTSD